MSILVTGANRGIGLALVRELLSLGESVIATARDPKRASDLIAIKQESGGKLDLIELDVTSDAAVANAAKVVVSKSSGLDVLVNNAAVFPEEGNESLMEIDLQHFRDAFETNVVGVVRVTRAFVPLLEKAQNPRIVNISSGAGSISEKTDHGYYAYSTSKAALNMATRAMAAELKGKKICLVAMSPGWVKTDMGGPNALLTPEESAEAIAKTIARLTLKETSSFIDRFGKDQGGW